MRLETDRLRLDTLGPSHAERVLEFLVRNRDFFAPWEPLLDDGYFFLERQRTLLMDAASALRCRTRYHFWVLEKDTDLLVGSVNFFNVVRQDFLSCLVSVKTDRDVVRRGYMTEALGAGVRHMFRAEGLHRVEANVMPDNFACLRVLEKLGFEDEGLARNYLRVNGEWEDHLRMALRDE